MAEVPVMTADDERDRERLRWIASDAAAKRVPPPLGLFENETVGVIDVCCVLARRLIALEGKVAVR